MDLPVNFKFDVRIRSRLLAKGNLTEADVAKHLDALLDAQPHADMIDLPQPALTTLEERERAAARPSVVVPRPVASVSVERSAPISIAPAPEPVDEGWEDDDEDDVDDDDDDDDDVTEEAAKPEIAAAPAPPVPESPTSEPEDVDGKPDARGEEE